MSEITDTTEGADASPAATVLDLIIPDADVQVRDAAAREIDMRIVPWGVAINSIGGTEEFARGAFEGTDPTKVLLIGPEHERRLGLGHDGKPALTRHPVGRGMSIDERDDGAYMTFKVARTQGGDEVLALIADGVSRGVSIEFGGSPGGTLVQSRGGRRHSTHTRVVLDAVSAPVTRPAYGEHSTVLAVRSEAETGETPVTTETPQEAPVVGATIVQTSAPELSPETFARAMSAQFGKPIEDILDRLGRMEEQGRSAFQIPGLPGAPAPDDFHRGDWAHLVLKMMTGEQVSQTEVQARVAAELITADNLGVIPTAYLNEIIGIIDDSRPFLDSTTKVPLPRAGTTLSVPKIVTRPTTAIQAAEKDELASTTTSIVPATFGMVTIGGYGDISIQLLKRSDPSYLQLYVDLLAEAYAIDADDKAVDVLLAETAVVEGGELDPEDLQLGGAWENAAAVSRRLKLDRIWLSSAAVAAFIDAKNPLQNGPLYSTLAADITAANGTGGRVSGLVPVHVPALDDEAVDIIVGPSRGFVWTEDGAYTLQVDVPARAGRDVGIVGMAWFAPLYPSAFTTYTIPAS